MSDDRLFSRYEHVTYYLASFDAMGYGTNEEPEARVPKPFAESNVVTSIVKGGPKDGLHTLCLDIDWPAALIPSSSSDHSHLYIDCDPMPWEKYEKVLEALGDAGVIEPGYAAASIRRQHTSLRMPWVHKSVPGDHLNRDPWAAPEPPF